MSMLCIATNLPLKNMHSIYIYQQNPRILDFYHQQFKNILFFFEIDKHTTVSQTSRVSEEWNSREVFPSTSSFPFLYSIRRGN